MTDVGDNAPWRRQRLTHWDVLNRMYLQGKTPSPLFNAPWVKSHIFRRDWLHASDQGVAADFAGNALKLLTSKFPGGRKQERVEALFADINAWYERGDINVPHGDRLPCLTPTMIQGEKNRRSFAATRGLSAHLSPISKKQRD